MCISCYFTNQFSFDPLNVTSVNHGVFLWTSSCVAVVSCISLDGLYMILWGMSAHNLQVSISHGRQWHLLKCSLYPQPVLIPKLSCKSVLPVSSEHMKYYVSLEHAFLVFKKAPNVHVFPSFSLASAPPWVIFHLSTGSSLFCFFRCWKNNLHLIYFLQLLHESRVLWQTVVELPPTKSVTTVELVTPQKRCNLLGKLCCLSSKVAMSVNTKVRDNCQDAIA